jgi:hypothetical protein
MARHHVPHRQSGSPALRLTGRESHAVSTDRGSCSSSSFAQVSTGRSSTMPELVLRMSAIVADDR